MNLKKKTEKKEKGKTRGRKMMVGIKWKLCNRMETFEPMRKVYRRAGLLKNKYCQGVPIIIGAIGYLENQEIKE